MVIEIGYWKTENSYKKIERGNGKWRIDYL